MIRKGIAGLILSAALCVTPVTALRPVSETAPGAALAAEVAEFAVEVAGKVVHGSTATNRHLQVRAGTLDVTINVPENLMAIKGGKQISIHAIKAGSYIRVTGRRNGNTRMEATRIWVIGDRYDFMNSRYGKVAGGQGYIRRI
jgi:hypothetical protein